MESKNYICKCKVLRINKDGRCQVPSNILSIFYESLNLLKKKKTKTRVYLLTQQLFGVTHIHTPPESNMIIALLFTGPLERVAAPHHLQIHYLKRIRTKLLIYDHDKRKIL